MKSQSSVFDQSDLPRTQSGDTPAPESTRYSRKLVIAFEPQREIAVPAAHLHHAHNDASLRPDALAPIKVLLAAATPTHHRHLGINE